MKNSRSGVAALAAIFVMAASPAFAVTATCTAKDSAGKHWTATKTDLIDWSAKTFAGALAKADCQDHSKHPATCQVVSCKMTK